MLKSMEQIEQYTKGVKYDSFLSNQMMIDAVIRNLEIIVEAAGKIPNEVQIKYNEVPGIEMKSLRNVLIHEYFGVDSSIIWNISTKDLPKTKDIILKVIQEEGDIT